MSLIRELDDIVKAERLLKRYNDKFARFNRRKVSYVDWLKWFDKMKEVSRLEWGECDSNHYLD